MTFAARTLGYLGGTGVVSSLPIVLSDAPATGGAAAAVTFNTNGSITVSGDGSTAPTNWYIPTTTSIGNSYWIKFVLNSGSQWVGYGTTLISGTVYALSSARGPGWTVVAGTSKSANATVTIYSDSGGINALVSGTFNVNITGA